MEIAKCCAYSAQTKLEEGLETIDKDKVSTDSLLAEIYDQNKLQGEPETKGKGIVSTDRKTEDAIQAETDTKDKEIVSKDRKTDDAVQAEIDTEDKEIVSKDRKTDDAVQSETEHKDEVRTETGKKSKFRLKKSKREDTKRKGKSTSIRNKKLREAIVEGSWDEVESIIKEDKDAITEAINSDGNTILHIAVGIFRNYIVSEMLSLIKDVDLPQMRNLDGSTALHIAAIVGNTRAAQLLVRKNQSLLEITDGNGETPFVKAYENMNLDTIEYFLKTISENISLSPSIQIGVKLLVNAVSAKQYDLATKLIKRFPKFPVENDNVLMAIARTFLVGLDYWETLVYPNMDENFERIVEKARDLFQVLVDFRDFLIYQVLQVDGPVYILKPLIMIVITFLVATLLLIYYMIRLLMLILYFPLFLSYFLSWEVSTRLGVAPIKHIVKKKKEYEEAKEILKLVCEKIDRLEFPDEANPRFYTGPILEAASQNAYEVVEEILMRCPQAIRYRDKSGHDIIQLAVIHRSEKIYNLIYILGEPQSIYRMIEDSSKNNMLHLAGRLAPSQKLKLISGAALQLQRELQWREEVKKLVFPAHITKENIFMETPDMVFTKEHGNLVKEGEKWMRAVAESCSITATLITTIVFAAAITVPGGSNQNTGIPLYTEDIAFSIFAISDAISLFASSTTLLMFQSILTGRFSEQDFLVSLPRRLIIGFCTLMISTTAMMVAFGTTLYLVFWHRKPWMIAPIFVLGFLPIASFGTLQIPLIVDLFRSTYVRIFGKQCNKKTHGFNPDDIRLSFGK